jgi:hypothetical protein
VKSENVQILTTPATKWSKMTTYQDLYDPFPNKPNNFQVKFIRRKWPIAAWRQGGNKRSSWESLRRKVFLEMKGFSQQR